MRRCLQCETIYMGLGCPKCGSKSWENGDNRRPVYQVSIRERFDAAHHLRGDIGKIGKCAQQHGHGWVVEVVVERPNIDSLGMVIDFRDLKSTLQEKVIDVLDHRDLNEIPPFTEINPTAENLARWIYEQMMGMVGLVEVRVFESPGAMASYSEA